MQQSKKIIRLPATIQKTGLSRSTIYALEGRGDFPKKLNYPPELWDSLNPKLMLGLQIKQL